MTTSGNDNDIGDNDKSFGRCRCCLKNGYHKDITVSYDRNGVREVYRETFLGCFNLSLSLNTKLTNLICTSCISKLNNALEFRTMVAESELQLISEMIGSNKTVCSNDPALGLHSELDIELEVKEEPQEVKEEPKEVKEEPQEVKEEPQDFSLDYENANVDNEVSMVQPKKKAQSREEVLRKKRENERKRYEKIKNDPEKLAAYKEKDKQKYLKERVTGVRKTISEMTECEKRECRKSWRERSRKHYYY